MDIFQQIHGKLQDLDRRNLISISWIKRWIISLVVFFVLFSYTWTRLFSGINDDHIPKALRPLQAQLNDMDYVFHSEAQARSVRSKEINFVVFACAQNSEKTSASQVALKTLRTMKSATLSTRRIIHFHIFTEDKLFPTLIKLVDQWPNTITHRVSFDFHPTVYPEWIVHDKPHQDSGEVESNCDLAFMFIPNIIKDLDFVLYAKSGSTFLGSVDELWENLENYDDSNTLSVPVISKGMKCPISYEHFSDRFHQTFDPTLVLFDVYRLQEMIFYVPVTRLNNASANWLPINPKDYEVVEMTWNPNMILAYYNIFKNYIISPGKDLLNIIALFNPSRFNTLSCEWSFQLDDCTKPSVERCSASKCIGNVHLVNTRTVHPVYEKVCELIDDTKFDFFNNLSLEHDVKLLRKAVYKEWPAYSLCSLRNIDLFEAVISQRTKAV
ncbi:unnamed protein product [Clavelina lepadiformis]|uniref:Uncharacterized protein n=1 Tax=Clavelina lepadiformis TaxID=159417 RepID=A0ABP0FSK3_CLALP